jgi:hypothetical protein
LAGLILFRPHQAAALRRPRTEARPRRVDHAKGIDQSRPVTEAQRNPPFSHRKTADYAFG